MAAQKTISPVDGSVYVERELADPARVEATLDRASAAQRAWREVPLAERARYCSGAERATPGSLGVRYGHVWAAPGGARGPPDPNMTIGPGRRGRGGET